MSKFIISLDFELHWGSIEKWDLSNMKFYFLNARESIPTVLSMFENNKIRATWATIGYLLAKNKDQLLDFMPKIKPTYSNASLSSYNLIEQVGKEEKDDPFHYAGSIINKILSTKGQEIGSHTFSHYYSNEEGQTIEQFGADLKAAQALVKENYGLTFKSLVFPRNQFNQGYLKMAKSNGFKVVRSNPSIWIWEKDNTKLLRIARAIDTLVSISKPLSFKDTDIKTINGILCLPSSRFFRAYNTKEKLIQNAKMNRIKNEMTFAAKNNMNYHLWWHPHNFGYCVRENIKQLEDIITHYQGLNSKFGFESANMGDFA